VTDSPAVLVVRSLNEIFNQRDASKRRYAIEELCSPTLVFADPEGETRGIDASAQKVEALLSSGAPTFEFRSVAPAQEAQNMGLHRGELGPAGEAPVVSGTDVVLVEDGLIVAFYTVLD
jgi:hypothetical protein